jgi:hypothetical protein
VIAKFTYDGDEMLQVAVLVDIDGTLAGLYENGKRKLRPSAIPALKLLSDHAPVSLWSNVGHENGRRLLREYPDLREFISGCFDKEDFPLDRVEVPYAIDDDPNHEKVYGCNRVILEESYLGGKDTGDLMEAGEMIIADIKRRPICVLMDKRWIFSIKLNDY